MTLVLKGGEVRKEPLPDLVDNVLVIGFVWVERTLAAVGGVKRPKVGYRGKIFKRPLCLTQEAYPYELGRVFVDERFRRMGMARALTARLVRGLASPVYATSRVNNEGMHKALVGARFQQAGEPYAGRHRCERFQVFLRPAVASVAGP
jgi:hypothetical protein